MEMILTRAAEAAVEKMMTERPALPFKKELFATKKSWLRKFLGISQKKILLSFVPFWYGTALYQSRERDQSWWVHNGKLMVQFPIGFQVLAKGQPIRIIDRGEKKFEEEEVYHVHFSVPEIIGPEVFPLTAQQASWLAGENRSPSWGTAEDLEKVRQGPVKWTMRDADI